VSRDPSFPPPINAQIIEGIVRYRESMSADEIAEALFGDRKRVGDISGDLIWLVKTVKYLGCSAEGRYFPAEVGPVNLNANDHVRPWANDFYA
jgi:hypothetical protein